MSVYQSNASFLVALILAASVAIADDTKEFTPAKSAAAKTDAKIVKLIGQLGSDEFATREKAQAELEQLGLIAFEALHEAQNHDDIEVALRARYLIRSMQVNWATDEDPPEVKRILRQYGAQSEDERKNRMGRLARLDDAAGIPALCRLVRFESSRRLSKLAALMVMNYELDPAQDMKKIADVIRGIVGTSQHFASQWIATYADTLVDAESTLDQWKNLISIEHETFTNSPERSTREVVLDLYRWHAKLLEEINRKEEALAVMRQSVRLLDGSTRQLSDMVDWLMLRKAWKVVDELAERFSERFKEEALLLYRLAESQTQQGQMELAEATAEDALKISPDNAEVHLTTAASLQDRGLIQWAEREFRYVIKIGPVGSIYELRSRLILAEMLHDIERELDAAQILKGAVDVVEMNPAALDVLENRLYRKIGPVKSRMHYFYACDYQAKGEFEKQREQLDLGVKSDPTDADVLIGMYRVANPDEAWKAETKKRLDAAAGFFRERISMYERSAAQAPNEQNRAAYNWQLASMNNQLAWLVSNTTGDFDEALKCSKRSLELRPDTGGYMDTLGRCYYAKGDFENAVKTQRQAVKLDRHSQQIRRQLDLFEEALAKAKKGQSKDDASTKDSEKENKD